MRRPGAALLALALGFTGCAPMQPPTPVPDPVPAPPAPPPPPLRAAAPEPRPDRPQKADGAALRAARAAAARAAADAAEAPASATMGRYLQGVEAQLVARGKLRTDSGAADGPPTAERLVEDFVAIALHDEFAGSGAARDAVSASLRRWAAPVRIGIEFGASVPPDQRVRDRHLVASFAARLARVTGHDIAPATDAANFHLFIVGEDERRTLGPRLAAAVPGMPAADIAALQALTPQTACTAFGYGDGDGTRYAQVVGVVRAELPTLSRTACFHEEMAQGLGLTNDDSSVRPSIFNDDEEFAYLTRHDELLLQMLYDPRLRPGMTEAEVRPVAAVIAAGLLAPPP